jgi:restriction system protein
MAEEPRSWIVRGSKNGARDQWMLSNSFTGVDFFELPSLADVSDLAEMRTLVGEKMPGLKPGAVGNYAAQLFAFAHRIQVGDTVVLPIKNSGQVALGVVTGEYEYVPGDGILNHVRKVDWKRADVPRTAIHQDLLYSLGAFSTVAQVARNDGAWRLRRIMDGAEVDPGARGEVALPSAADAELLDTDEAVANDGFDVLRYSKDRVLGRLAERFAGHRLTDVVASILRAEGLTCTVSPPGPDGGVDILAAGGPLGISSPTIVVQVKSEPTPVGSPVVDQLGGVVAIHQADHGLLVAMGGLKKPARDKIAQQPFKFVAWDAEELVRRLYEHYEEMPEDIKIDLPLKRAWVLDET